MKSFDLMSMMNNASLRAGDGQPKYELKCLPITALYPDPENQNTYSVDKIEDLARDIEFAGAVLHNLVVRAAGEDGKYRIISGERRWRASCLLVKERGLEQFREVNCLVEHENDPDILDLLLILTNSSARELTDAEKMRQAERMTEILKKLSQKTKMQGRIRDLVAEKLNTTSGQLARYHAIAKNLTNPDLKQAFEKGELGISAAYEASGLSEGGQEKLAGQMETGRGIPLQAVTVAKMQERQDSPEWQEKMRKVQERRAASKSSVTEKKEGSAHAMIKTTYCFSTDGEEFGGEFDTVEEALEEARQPYQGAGSVVYVGENKPFKPSIDGVEIIESMQEQADDAIGEEAEYYLENVNRDDIEKLGTMLTDTFNRWAKETRNEPNIFVAVNVKGYKLEEHLDLSTRRNSGMPKKLERTTMILKSLIQRRKQCFMRWGIFSIHWCLQLRQGCTSFH